MNGFVKGVGIGMIAGIAATAILSNNRQFTRNAMKNVEKVKQALGDTFDNVVYVFRK